MTKIKPKVSIIIPAFNEEKYIGDCLNSIFKSDYPSDSFEVILIDNGSSDKTISIAKQYPIHIYIKKDIKVGALRNLGVSHAAGEYIIFIDSDCTVDTDWISIGIKRLEDNSKLVLGGQYLMRENPSWLEKYWVLNNSRTQIYQTTLVGGSIFIPKSTFLSVAGFDEKINSGEDSDLTYRLRSDGYNVEIDPALSVVHLGYPSEVIPFIRRQIWHSSDYATNFKNSIRDKVFILTSLFLISIIVTLIQLTIFKTVNIYFLTIALLSPTLLTYKRVLRSKTKYTRPFDLISIYLIDILYLTGRSLGTLISLKNLLFAKSTHKVNKK